jgi:hypothetical protein
MARGDDYRIDRGIDQGSIFGLPDPGKTEGSSCLFS